MRLSAPKQITWWIGLILLVLGVIANFIASVSGFALWVVVVAALLMLVATAVQGL